ncbi:translation initiation factor IF-5A, partial [Candidatus Woesearchaeota archaeon]|nr:translation initiation factor IF-5A [Candidatus Woesearchaeota archaeon]
MSKKVVGVNEIKVGSFIIIDDIACKVTSCESSKSGKHGHAKYRIVAVGLLDGKKREILKPSGETVEVPIIDKKTAQVLSVSGDVANVMDVESYETFDLKIPEEFKGQVVEGAQVLFWVILGEKVLKQV